MRVNKSSRLSQIGFRVGSIGNFQVAAQLLHVERDPNPILSSIRVSMSSLAEIEVTCILFRVRLLQLEEVARNNNIVL